MEGGREDKSLLGWTGQQWLVRQDTEFGSRHFTAAARLLRRDVLQAAGFMGLDPARGQGWKRTFEHPGERWGREDSCK